MKFSFLRIAVAAAVFIILAIGIILGLSTGTLCGLGWNEISILCPLGALLLMISSRTIIPQAVLCIAIAAVLIFLLGRAFCGWVCPVTLWRHIVNFFRPAKERKSKSDERSRINQDIASEAIEAAKQAKTGGCASCGKCGDLRRGFDSRHAVLGASVFASAIFGFPVFCVICPIGLSFAVISLLVGLFAFGDLNWTLLFAPAFLIIEVVVLRKWCSRFCPLSALMSLVGRFSKTTRPQIDNAKCLETSKGVVCSQCATVCKYDINLRHPEHGELPVHDCVRCMECVDACPAQAISIKLLNGREEGFVLSEEACRVETEKGEDA